MSHLKVLRKPCGATNPWRTVKSSRKYCLLTYPYQYEELVGDKTSTMKIEELHKSEMPFNKTAINPNHEDDESHYQLISFLSDVPAPLQAAMTSFIEKHPNWDQYRLIQAAIAGFLVQNGVDSRQVTRLYLDNMFGHKNFNQESFTA